MKIVVLIGWIGIFASWGVAQEAAGKSGLMQQSSNEHILTSELVSQLANLALKGLDQEYPNKPSNVMVGPESVQTPREMHPAFYGCFDWHSSVHGHWMLVRLMRLYPDHPQVGEIRGRLAEHLTAENLLREAEHFRADHNKLFERMYGWAWLFRLVTELEEWNDEQGNVWRANLRPLEEVLVERVQDYLPKLSYPIRTGVHPNTAFAMVQILDYARVTKKTDLADLICQRGRDYFLKIEPIRQTMNPQDKIFFPLV